MQEHCHNDVCRIGSPVVGLAFAFVIGNNCRKVLRSRYFFRSAYRYFIERVPACRTAVRSCRFKLYNGMPHPCFTVACRNAPVFRFYVIYDNALFPAAEQRRHYKPNAFAASCRGDNGKMLIAVISQIKVPKRNIKFKKQVI